MKLPSVVILCLLITQVYSWCTEGYSILCDNLADVKSYGNPDWVSLIIGDANKDPTEDATLERSVFNKCQNLEELTILATANGLDTNAFTGLSQLLILKLYKNSLRSLSDLTFDSLPRLSKLDLQNNNIEQLTNEGSFANSTLTTVNLSHNRIRKLYLNTFKVPGMQTLKISHNEISELGPTNIFSPDLEILDLDHNHLYHIQAEVFRGMDLLEELNLSNNRFATFRVQWQLKRLDKLDLSHNSIAIVGPGVFDEMPRLEYLYLNHNFIKELPLGLFQSNFEQLRLWKLLLHNNRFQNMEFLVKGVWPALTDLTFAKNPWPCDCLSHFLSFIVKLSNITVSFCEKQYFEDGNIPVCVSVESEWSDGKCILREEPYGAYDDFFKAVELYSCY